MIHDLLLKLKDKISQREPDFIVGRPNDPYLLRWFVIPRNRFFNIYLHKFMRSDDDRALHDHPWSNFSYLLDGQYTEHIIQAGGVHRRSLLTAGTFKMRWSGKYAHRVELTHGHCWTIFVTGPRYRQWGFHCPDAGWKHWKDFTSSKNKGEVGPGCGD